METGSAPAPAPAPPVAPSPAGLAARVGAQLQTLFAALLTAVATLSFVAFTGGVVLWARARAWRSSSRPDCGSHPEAGARCDGCFVARCIRASGPGGGGGRHSFDHRGVTSMPTRLGLLVLVAVEVVIALRYADPSTWEWIITTLLMVVGSGGVWSLGFWNWSARWVQSAGTVPPDRQPHSPRPTAATAAGGSDSSSVSAGDDPLGRPPEVHLTMRGKLVVMVILALEAGGIALYYGESWLLGAVGAAVVLYLVVLAIGESYRQSLCGYGGGGDAVRRGVRWRSYAIRPALLADSPSAANSGLTRAGEGKPCLRDLCRRSRRSAVSRTSRE